MFCVGIENSTDMGMVMRFCFLPEFGDFMRLWNLAY